MTTEEEIFKRVDQMAQLQDQYAIRPSLDIANHLDILYARVIHLAKKRREETGQTYPVWPSGGES